MKQIAGDNIKLDYNQINKELAKKMNNPYILIHRNSEVGFKSNLDSHHINHAISKLTSTPNFPEFGLENRYVIKIMKELSVINARLINQYKFKHQTVFSARFNKQDEDNQVIDETELYINLKLNHKFNRNRYQSYRCQIPMGTSNTATTNESFWMAI